MSTLASFLLARIAEDAEVAQGLADDYPSSRDEMMWYRNGEDVGIDLGVGRALAECESKRRIVERHGGFDLCDVCRVRQPCPDLLALGQPYADHSDFDEEWRL
jgi:hypothetical protein